MMSGPRIIAALLLLAGAVPAAQADQITLTLTGQVTGVDDAAGLFGGSATAGATLHATVTFSTTGFNAFTPRADGADYGYAPAGGNGMAFTVGSLTGASEPAGTFTLGIYNQTSELPGLSALGTLGGNGAFLALDLYDPLGLVTGTAIPSAETLGQLTDGLFQVNLVNEAGAVSYLSAEIGSFTVDTAPVAPVPEPSALLLALVGWWCAPRRARSLAHLRTVGYSSDA